MNKPCKKNDIFFNITSVVADAYAAEIRAFVDCIVEDRPFQSLGQMHMQLRHRDRCDPFFGRRPPVTVAESGA